MIAQVDHIFVPILLDQFPHQIAVLNGFGIICLFGVFIKGFPTVPGDFVRADQRRVAVALIILGGLGACLCVGWMVGLWIVRD